MKQKLLLLKIQALVFQYLCRLGPFHAVSVDAFLFLVLRNNLERIFDTAMFARHLFRNVHLFSPYYITVLLELLYFL